MNDNTISIQDTPIEDIIEIIDITMIYNGIVYHAKPCEPCTTYIYKPEQTTIKQEEPKEQPKKQKKNQRKKQKKRHRKTRKGQVFVARYRLYIKQEELDNIINHVIREPGIKSEALRTITGLKKGRFQPAIYHLTKKLIIIHKNNNKHQGFVLNP